MLVKGVRSSWETLATNSRRISSFFRCSVTSWRTAKAPSPARPRLKGAMRSWKKLSRTRSSSSRWSSAASTCSRAAPPLKRSSYVVSGPMARRSIRAAAGLEWITFPAREKATTPSVMWRKRVSSLFRSFSTWRRVS